MVWTAFICIFEKASAIVRHAKWEDATMPDARRVVGVMFFGIMALLAAGRDATASPIVFDSLDASLNTGSLAGVSFPVSFSYDAGEVAPIGESFVTLTSFDFTLLGVHFTRGDIFQGGQAIFEDGVLNDVTASFQVFLPPQSPVENITFGFGGPGVIGYIDLNHQFGSGSFTSAPAPAPEPATVLLVGTGLAAYLARSRGLKPPPFSTRA
jgi:hypothetical protein